MNQPLLEFDPLIERAARLFCEYNGIDPEQGPTVAHPTIIGGTMKIPQWKLFAPEFEKLNLMIASLSKARHEAKTKGEKNGNNSNEG